jgi:hypothetical protein
VTSYLCPRSDCPPGRGVLAYRTIIAVTACVFLAGCDSLNPAFTDLLDSSGQLSSIPNAPGHVVIAFINNAEVDGRLLTYLAGEGGLTLTPDEQQSLRPRARLRVRVTFTNGATQTFEFIDGNANLVEQSFNDQSVTDLNQNGLFNVVVVCGVARVEVVPGSQIEVFIPATLAEFEQRQIQTPGGETGTEDVLRQEISPRFRALQLDDVDEDNNVILQRNIDIRDASVPVVNPVCGSVVAITMNGVLTVPFFKTFDFPSYDFADETTVAGIGGRFEFRVLSVAE